MLERALTKLRHICCSLCLTPQDLENGAADLPAIKQFLADRDTRLQEAEKELKLLRADREGLIQHYKILTGNLAASVIIRDAEQNISYCSPYTEVLTGYAVSEIYAAAGDFFLQIIHEEDREKYLRASRVIEAGEPFQFRYRILHKSGIEIWAETRTVPVTDDAGKLLFSLSLTFDVTGTVRYQHQVEEKNRELRDFTYMVSHDLKAPIFTIKGMVKILNEELGKQIDAESRDILNHIGNATDRLDQLVKSVLEYSRVSSQEIKAEPIDLRVVLEEVLADLKPQIDEISARVAMPLELPALMGEKLKLYQIFSNIIGNALKFRELSRAPQIDISVSALPAARYVQIHIRDNGRGIPAEKLPTIFRPFQRVHHDVEGSGIGLACVKRLVEKMGGEVTAESQQGRGSCFSVTLRRS